MSKTSGRKICTILSYPVLAERVRQFKESDKGVSDMSKIWDELLEKSKELGLYEGERQGIDSINALNNMLIKAGRLDDLTRATTDPDYQKKLMAELLPSA